MHTYSRGSPRCPGVRHAGNLFRFVCEGSIFRHLQTFFDRHASTTFNMFLRLPCFALPPPRPPALLLLLLLLLLLARRSTTRTIATLGSDGSDGIPWYDLTRIDTIERIEWDSLAAAARTANSGGGGGGGGGGGTGRAGESPDHAAVVAAIAATRRPMVILRAPSAKGWPASRLWRRPGFLEGMLRGRKITGVKKSARRVFVYETAARLLSKPQFGGRFESHDPSFARRSKVSMGSRQFLRLSRRGNLSNAHGDGGSGGGGGFGSGGGGGDGDGVGHGAEGAESGAESDGAARGSRRRNKKSARDMYYYVSQALSHVSEADATAAAEAVRSLAPLAPSWDHEESSERNGGNEQKNAQQATTEGEGDGGNDEAVLRSIEGGLATMSAQAAPRDYLFATEPRLRATTPTTAGEWDDNTKTASTR